MKKGLEGHEDCLAASQVAVQLGISASSPMVPHHARASGLFPTSSMVAISLSNLPK